MTSSNSKHSKSCLRTKSEYGRSLILDGDNYQPDFYYYLITIKNNKSPETIGGFDTFREFGELMHKILILTKSAEIKSAFELDSKNQLHEHVVVYSKKIINPIWLNKYIKADMPYFKSWMINVSFIKDGYHLQNSINYLDSSKSDFFLAKYNYNAPNECARFID